jgi:hypothetical protein
LENQLHLEYAVNNQTQNKMKNIALIILFATSSIISFAQCTEAKEPDMAKYKKLTETKDAQGCSQCAMLALYFCSARHCVEMEDKRKVRSMIEACKTNIRTMGQPYCCPEYLSKEPEWGVSVTNSQEGSGPISEVDEKARIIENKVNAAIQSFYAFEAASNARNNMRESSKLNGDFSSIEQLEAAFRQNLAAIEQSSVELEAANNSLISAGAELIFNNGNEVTQAVGQIAVGIGSLINEASVENQKKAAEERLKAERAKQIAIIEQKKRDQITAFRKEVFATFRDGGVPLSSHGVKSKELYFFAYISDKNNINAENYNVKVSNVFPVAMFADETWPFKNNLVQDIGKNGSGTVTLMGYYVSKQEAEKTRSSFVNILAKSFCTVSDFNYKGTKAETVKLNKDFWGNDKSGSTNSDAQKQSSFWDK